MGVISRLPQGGGGGGFIFNITTTESSLFGQDIIITGAEPTKTVTFSADGKATAKAKKAGTYTFTCGGAVYSQEYQLYGEYPVELNLYDAVITVTGKVQLARPMDSRYIVPDGYYKPNNVDGMQVSLYDGASQIAIPQAFSGGGDTVTFTVDTREHTNVTVKFSDEGAKGFTNPADVPLTLEKGVPASASGTWVEKYAELEVQKMDAELLPFDVILKWGETADEQITWTTDNVSDKSKFICKTQSTYKVECNEAKEDNIQITQSMLENTHIYGKTIKLSVQPIPLIPILTATNENVICINQDNPWMAFDGNDTTQSTQLRYLDVAIGYKFDNKVTVTSVLVKDVPNPLGDSKDLKVEYSDDGSTYTTIATIDRSAHKDGNMTYELPISHDTPHYYYRIFAPIANYQAFFTVQFYGRLG